MKEEPRRQTLRRSLDEPKLKLGARISLKDGATGVVLARYMPSGKQNEVCYIVELVPDEGKGKT